MRFFILSILFLTVILTSVSFANVRNIGEGYRFVYNIVDASGAHVSGQVPTVKIQKASTGAWLDFNDGVFKASGWVSKTAQLSENVTDGYYFYQFTPPASETTPDQYVFVIDNTNPTYADHVCLTVNYEQMGSTLTAEGIWQSAITSGFPVGSAGRMLSNVNDATDGDREGADYTGIERMIRVNR